MAEAGSCRRNDHVYPARRDHRSVPQARLAMLSIRAEAFDSTGDKVLEFESAVMVKVDE
jgi:hypothetical protein